MLRWVSSQPAPPALHFFRTHGGREIDVVLHAAGCVLGIEAKASRDARRTDTGPLVEGLERLSPPGAAWNARRLGPVVTRGREVEPLAPGVWAVPDWRLFGPTAFISPSSG